MTSTITICDTCKRDDWQARAEAQTDGERWAEMIEAAADGNPHVRTRRHSCLMGCARGCNVAIQSAGKLAYTLGDFTPSDEAAHAVVEYAALHAQSESGTVPYRQWPQPIKGHFVTRHPPLPDAS
ncbi:MAG: DUF1636 domain-containing protein [Paracoccaceae bacterium]